MNPTNTPATTAEYLRAMRGPVLLIVLGLLLAIDHLGSFSFRHTWPVLLIVIGLMFLLEHLAPSAGPQGRI